MRAWQLLLGLVGVLAAGSSGARVEVPTRNGVVAGEADEVHQTFLGIPYGQAPVGNYRFASPRPALSWSPAVFNATEQPKACPGTFQSLFELLPAFEVDEDCLTLSIYTPNRERMSKPLPVMFWIYGGAYILGDGYEFGMYDGSYLVSTRDVIIVTHNYRLGPFGYLVAEGGAEGNYGIEDQRLALQWVIDNIANFGGDPNQITLFGESAGAMSVGIHMISPLSKGMFQRAIMQSNAMGLQFKSREQALKVSKRLAKVLDCPEGNELECLRAADWRNVAYKRLPIFFAGMEDLVGDILAWGPTIDNNNMVMQPIEAFNAGAFHDVPTIWGTNKDEMALFRGLIENALDLLGLVTGRNGTVEIGPLVYNVLINLMFKEKADMILDKYPPSFRQDNFPLLEEVLTEYVFHCSSRNAALGNARTSTSPVYTYEFVHVAEWAPMLGRLNRLCFSTSSCHAMELPYVFHTERVTLVPVSPRFTEREEYMSQKMMDYWTAFAAGNVNGKNPPVEWSVFSPSKQIALEISPEFSTKNWDTATCDFWDEVGYTF